MKRREPLPLAHVLEDRRLAAIPVPIVLTGEPRSAGNAVGAPTSRDVAHFDHTGESPRPAGDAVGVPTPRDFAPLVDKRIHIRFDKAFLVVIGSELYGDSFAVARNISAGGILVEMTYAPPLGTIVTVHFQHARDDGELDEIVARAEVKHHHYLNFAGGDDAASARAIGLRFLDFLDPADRIAADRVH